MRIIVAALHRSLSGVSWRYDLGDSQHDEYEQPFGAAACAAGHKPRLTCESELNHANLGDDLGDV